MSPKAKRIKKVLLLALLLRLTLAVIERLTLPETTNDMTVRAIDFGNAHSKTTPPQPFVFDGCTWFVDSLLGSDFRAACLEHDISYWYGGTKEERKLADKALQEAVRDSGFIGLTLNHTVYLGVRLFGDTFVTKSVNANWGFGHNSK